MIKTSTLSEMLKKTLENGIDAVFLCRISGDVLCSECKENEEEKVKTLPDVVSIIWGEYLKVGQEGLKKENLKMLIFENEKSNIISAFLFGYIIGMKASTDITIGKLKAELLALYNALDSSLEPYKESLMSKY